MLRWMYVVTCGSMLLAAQRQDRTPVESSRAAIEEAVLEVNAQMARAAQDLDLDRLYSFLLPTEKGSVIQNGVLLLTREQALARSRSGFTGIRKIEYRWKQRHVTVVSATVAILVAEGDSTATTEQGETFVTPFAQTVVFVLADGRWKVLHAHHSSPVRR